MSPSWPRSLRKPRSGETKWVRVSPLVFTLSAAAAMLAIVTLCVPHNVWSYEGPGKLRDNGLLSYPRFQLELPRVELGPGQQRSVTFTGVPSGEMSVMLYVTGSSLEDFDTLKALQVQITARLFEEATAATPRRVVCEATGVPSGTFPESQWVVTANRYQAALWHCRCLRISVSSERRYTLDLVITPTGPLFPPKVIVPTLEGGGVELP